MGEIGRRQTGLGRGKIAEIVYLSTDTNTVSHSISGHMFSCAPETILLKSQTIITLLPQYGHVIGWSFIKY